MHGGHQEHDYSPNEHVEELDKFEPEAQKIEHPQKQSQRVVDVVVDGVLQTLGDHQHTKHVFD